METTQPEIGVKNITWKNHETGEVYENSADILYYKTTLLEEKYKNLTIGDYNLEGNYVISRELLEELVNVNKFISDYQDGVYHLVAKSLSGELFELRFYLRIKKEGGKAIAILSLREIIEGLADLETNIARYKDDDNIYFLQKVAKVFHIFEKKDKSIKEEENEAIIIDILMLKKVV